jgi:hypothetical protein
MPAPTVTDIDKKSFKCKAYALFHIIGTGFSYNVSVTLQETRYGNSHEWIPPSGTWRSTASSANSTDGTSIEINARPQRKDGLDCTDNHELGDLTVTVTNLNPDGTSGLSSGQVSFNVAYTP